MAGLQTVILLAVLVSVNFASPKAKFAFLTHNEKTHQYEVHEEEEFSSSMPWVIKGSFLNQMNETGWSYLSLTSNSSFPDKIQAYGAGYVEGALTCEQITQHWMNTRDGYCPEPYNPYCQRLHDFLQENLDWMNKQIKANAVELLLYQVSGITDGYFNVSFGKRGTNLDPFGLLPRSASASCHSRSGSVQFAVGLNVQASIYVLVPGRVITFSSYPGSLYSGDGLVSHFLWTELKIEDYSDHLHPEIIHIETSRSYYHCKYVTWKKVGVTMDINASLETTISNDNIDLWRFVKPAHVLEGIQTMVANRLAKTGADWADIFSQSNSGTYNNQWMIVSYNQFKRGIVINTGLLTVLEQMPGTIVYEDKTALLLNQTYWPSYNRPYFKKIFNMSGQQENVAKYGDFFTYDMAPRAQIFRRDQGKVMDIESITQLMRYNDFKQDPLSRCNCTPPYSATIAISARGDLTPANGTYLLKVLGNRPIGGIDLKLTNSAMFTELKFKAIAGPTWDDLPPFQWSTSDFKDLPHHGIPDLCKFEPIYFNGTVLDKNMKVLFNF